MTPSGSPPHRRARDPRRALRWYLTLVSVAGCALLATLVPETIDHLGHADAAVWLLFAFVIAGELLPIKLPGHEDHVTTSTPFMYALLIGCGLPVAAPSQAIASALADVRARRSPLAVTFNVGQMTLSLGAASLVLQALLGAPADQPDFTLAAADLPALALGGATFFVVNNLVVGTAAALAANEPVGRFLRDDLGFQALQGAMVVGFAPLVIAVADSDEWLIPLLALPLVTLHRGTRAVRLSDHQASHDGLTGLPNRKLFRRRAEAAIAEARRRGRIVAVLVMDLDRFKEVNDTLGHHHGDLLLQRIEPRLRQVLRPGDTIARFGGDEFAVLLEEVESVTEAELVAHRLLEALEQPFDVEGITLDVGASIGIVCAPEHGDDVDTLLQHGDVAMYIAKAGHLGWALYEPESDRNSVDRLALAGQLRRAFERDELVLHYQPQVEVATGRLHGAEALVRWQHPDRGLLPPDAFVPLAEHTGLIRALTHRALELAVAQAAEWRREGIALVMSVNASSRDVLDHGLVQDVEQLLERHGLPGTALTIEITESTLMVDPRRAQLVLEQLSAMGVGIAVDDFGTGYSSLAYLKKLPIDHVKIDRSFVLGMADDESDAAIVASTIDLARNLGMGTVAEGVEDEVVLARLHELGCDIAQGYHFSRPLEASGLVRWVGGRGLQPARSVSSLRG